MNAKTIWYNPKVKKSKTIVIKNHLISPLKSGTKNPKKNIVHENPIGAALMCPLNGFSNLILLFAIITSFCVIIKLVAAANKNL